MPISIPARAYIAALSLLAAILLSPAAALSGAPPDGLDYYMEFSPARPTPGSEVTVTLAQKPGLRPPDSVRWRLGGAQFRDAGTRGGNPLQYSFTPVTPGAFVITADFRDPRGGTNSVTMELTIGAALPVPQAMGRPDGQTMAIDQMFIGVDPQYPRLGQPTVFTLHMPGGLTGGAKVRWEVSGGPYANPVVSGPSGEVCSLVVSAQTAYYVRAVVVDGRGYPMGEVSLGFLPTP